MFHAQYMLALGHYEQATNELAKAMTMMENNDYKSAYLHFNASVSQGLRTISAIDLQKMITKGTNAGLNRSHKKVPDFSAGIPTVVRQASTVQDDRSSEAFPDVSKEMAEESMTRAKELHRTASYTVDKQTPLLDFFTIFIENIPGDHSPGTSTNLYPTPHTVWIYSFVVTSRSFWRILLMIQNTALLTSTGSSFQTAW